MKEQLNALLDSYREEYIRTLQEWIRVPSVRSEAETGAPFGKDVARMMDLAVRTAREMGFTVREFDGYACDVTLGDQPEVLGVLGHLDVVPVGDGWKRPPFGAEMEDGRIYGRGSSDDKGPTLAALFAMKALKEAGIPLKRSIRLIMGGDEECDWQCMEYYGKHAEMPKIGFSPDASFPLINTEKGMLHFELRFPRAERGLRILEMSVGERPNVIAGESSALVEGGEELAEKARAFAKKTGLDLRAEMTDRGLRLTATGISGHSAYPEGKRSAIGMMLLLLKELGAEGGIATLAEAVGLESDGRGLGCACRDEVSGPLTNNMGILRLQEGAWYATLDFRCPVTADQDGLIRACREHLPGIDVQVITRKAPHHVPADSELVKGLLAAYEEESGLQGECIATGGGTYAKVLEQGVAFGAIFPHEEELAHLANEYVNINSMMTAMKIYANALVRLCAE